MLGQHVYIEMDEGQEDLPDGMWLDEYYFITDEDGAVTPYVWAADSNDKLEIREVTFGSYDEDLMKYEVVDGLTEDDYIAFPEGDLAEGMPVTRNVDQMNYSIDYGTDYGYEYDFGSEDDFDMDAYASQVEEMWLGEDDYSDSEWSEDDWSDSEWSEDDWSDSEWSEDDWADAEWSEDEWSEEE